MRRTLLCVAVTILFGVVPAAADEEDSESMFPRNEETGRYEFQEVVTVEGVGADELLRRARAWAESDYRSIAKGVRQSGYKDKGRVTVRGNTSTKWMLDTVQIHHSLTIEAREGRYRYTMTDFDLEAPSFTADLENREDVWPRRRGLLKRTAADVEEILASLKESMERDMVGAARSGEW